MSDKQALYDQPIEGHEYDGIEELDNPLPKWWLATFYGTIIFAVIYYGYFQLGPGMSHDERLASSMARIETAQVKAAEALAAKDDIDVNALLGDPAALEIGKAQYMSICMPCHGALGEGTVGPNLTDNYWIHSDGGFKGILASFRVGFPEKGMPPWGQLIPEEEHHSLAAFVISLRGTEPPNPKAPQGELVVE